MGIRVVFPSQGIDTQSEQSDLQITVHGLVDSLYVKELAKKTHRGLESRAIQGLHTGGVCYGYKAERIDASGATRLVVNEVEAKVVRQIFEMCANGMSLKGIAKELNARVVPPPRSKSSSKIASWCPTAIREMLRRPLYSGETSRPCLVTLQQCGHGERSLKVRFGISPRPLQKAATPSS